MVDAEKTSLSEKLIPAELIESIKINLDFWQSAQNSETFEKKLLEWTTVIEQRFVKLRGEIPPKVTVVIPAKNEERFILQTLDSLSKQNFRSGLEVIIVANNCNDRTADFARRCGIKVIEYQKENLAGPVAYARQQGLEDSQGEICISTDADALFKQDWVQLMISALEKDPQIACVTGGFRHWSLAGKNYQLPDITVNVFRRFLALKNSPDLGVGANMAFRKTDALQVGGYDLTRHPGEDVDLSRKLQKVGKIGFQPNLDAAVWVSARRIEKTGGLIQTLLSRRSEGGGYKDSKGNIDFR